MNITDIKQRLGRFVETSVGGETVSAFVPPPLLPAPAIDILPLLGHLTLAERAYGGQAAS